MLSVTYNSFMLSVIILNIVMLSVVTLKCCKLGHLSLRTNYTLV
jgi:hypothetical protein